MVVVSSGTSHGEGFDVERSRPVWSPCSLSAPDALDVALHEVAGESADSESGGAGGAGRAAHDRADDIVEERDRVLRGTVGV
jgi:hypothetical protein